MKKTFLVLLIILLSNTYAVSRTIFQNNDQRWCITGIVSNESYTAVFCDIHILSNAAGCIEAHKDDKAANIYLYGSWGKSDLIKTEYSGDYKSFSFVRGLPPEMNYYQRKNKGKVVQAVFYFTRIPAGVDYINWYCNGGYAGYMFYTAQSNKYQCPKFTATNIQVNDNPNTTPQTTYTEEKLKEVWSKRKPMPIEGVFSFLSTNSNIYWGNNRHTLAILKDGNIYKIIYLKGSNTAVWIEGELKGTFVPTNTKGLYKITSWYLENKMQSTADFYLEHNGNYATLYDAKSGVETLFMKLYPENELLNDNGDISTINDKDSTDKTSLKGNGSGFFVSGNVIATNHHVIDGAKEIKVFIQTEESIKQYSAKVLTVDKINDLALITIEDKDFVKYNTLPYQIASHTVDVGISIFTMGYPNASAMGTEIKVTDGIISAKTGFQGNVSTYQISAPIQPGNSGGPMFTRDGQLVGITSSGISGAENVGYAIKSGYLNNLIEAAPIKIDDISANQIVHKTLPEQIKILTPYVVLIYIY